MGNGSNQYRKRASASYWGFDDKPKKETRGRPRKDAPKGRNNYPQKGSIDQEIEDKKLTLQQASHLIDKNSKTMVKLVEILAIKESLSKREDEGIDGARDFLRRKIDMYKQRISRRLGKLAAWADDPRNEDKQQDKKFERAYIQENGTVNVQRKS